ncbi:MAG: tripartite tricarboxylate transporter substrate binding protein [Proteobacteria bacterium]|nr:tripartite tricarboxylate transporter substrate binding protein [Pseudomonadota bacterium]
MKTWQAVVMAEVLALALFGSGVYAQTYPTKPIRMIVTFPAGSGADIVARTAGQKMAESLGQQVVIDNRAGAGGIIGSDLAAKAIPDGYTIVMVSSAHTINASVYRKLPYDPEKDFAPITMLASTPYLLVAHPSVPIKTVADLIALAKAKPGQINYASGGIGVGSHLAGELFKTMTGVDIVNVPYKGAPQATADVVGGQVQLSLSTMPTALPLVRAGKLRAIAVTSLQRVPATPEFATIAETVPGFDVRTWQGLLAPKGTPPAIIAKLREHAVKALEARDVNERLSVQGYQTVGNTPQEFTQIVKSEIARWKSVVKAAGIKPIEGEQ